MIFDTDVLIWIQRGHKKAADLVDRAKARAVSIQTYMELLQCARNREQIKHTKDFLSEFGFQVIPFTENIGHRAAIYVEENSLSTGLRAGDAIIAATAVETNQPLCTANKKHFRAIQGLRLKVFKP